MTPENQDSVELDPVINNRYEWPPSSRTEMLLQDFTENVKQISSYSMYGIILFRVLAERDGGRDEENGCKCSYRKSIVENLVNTEVLLE